MNKLFKSLSATILGIALAAGVGVGLASSNKVNEVKAADQLVYTLNTSVAGTNNSYAGNCDITVNGVTWNVNGNSQQSPWRLGGNKISSVVRRIYSKTAIDENITKVGITFGTNSGSITVNGVKLNVYSTAEGCASGGDGDVASFAVTYSKDGSYTVTKADSTDWTGSFYSFDFTLTVTGSNNKYVTLGATSFYKESSGPVTYTVSYNNNGHGTAPTAEADIPEGGYATKPADPSETGYTFGGWFTEKECTNEWDFAVNTVNDNVTLYAKWTANSYTVSFDSNGATSGTAPSSIPSSYNAVVNLPNEEEMGLSGYCFAGWNEKADGSGKNYVAGASYTVKGDITFYANWKVAGEAYSLVEDIASLSVGDKVAFVGKAASNYYALSATQASNNRPVVSISSNGSSFVAYEDVEEITLGQENGHWTFAVDGGYLYAASSDSNYLRTQETNDANGEWVVTISGEGVASATAQGENTRNLLKFNSTSFIFSCYGSGQNDFYIYKKDATPSYDAAAFAQDLLDQTDAVCSTVGEKQSALEAVWTALEGVSYWGQLSASEQETFANASANQEGTVVEQAAARYDRLVSKYSLNNFALRSVSALGPNIYNSSTSDNNLLITIVAISVTSVSLLGVCIFLKKKRATH